MYARREEPADHRALWFRRSHSFTALVTIGYLALACSTAIRIRSNASSSNSQRHPKLSRTCPSPGAPNCLPSLNVSLFQEELIWPGQCRNVAAIQPGKICPFGCNCANVRQVLANVVDRDISIVVRDSKARHPAKSRRNPPSKFTVAHSADARWLSWSSLGITLDRLFAFACL